MTTKQKYRVSRERLYSLCDPSGYAELQYCGSNNLNQIFEEKLSAVLSSRYHSDMKYDVGNLIIVSGKLLRQDQNHQHSFMNLIPLLSIDCFSKLNRNTDGNLILADVDKKFHNNICNSGLKYESIIVSDRELFEYFTDGVVKTLSKLPEISKSNLLDGWKDVQDFDFVHSYPDDEYDRQFSILKSFKDSSIYASLSSNLDADIFCFSPAICSLPSNLLKLSVTPIDLLPCKTSELISPDAGILDEIQIKSIEAWMPCELGDAAINYVRSKTEDSLLRKSISISQKPTFRSHSDCTICVLHGNNESFLTKNLYRESGSHNITDIIPALYGTKLIILLACYSGKGGAGIVGNTTSSIVKSLIDAGAEAVIAPKWALHVDIASLWLNTFVESLNDGKNSFESYSAGVDEIYKNNPHPGAWACLHYFGKRNIRLNADSI